ncbi:response regulator transcription factor [Phycicoccus sonneratiae]|uniref:HTH luxR-type domain-containing protein n=1 Tax=Phycicoccus sonneratiae TaxID=2807628 RepID=A0ABS2CG94_9MICO|nr:LuxR C-terminal-related transcriptional regulator [Phycicoccus sonneraticus]MBM6398898.1 hypothetical protein [Phycicoccus sonneraticus]
MRPGPAYRTYLDTVPPLVDRGDPVLVPLGEGAALANSFAELEAATRHSVWAMKLQVNVSQMLVTRALDEASRARGIEERSVLSPSAARQQPLATTFEPTLRVGPSLSPLLVMDERYAVVAGSALSPDLGVGAWGTDDPDLVALACAAFIETWDSALPWREAGLREPLPDRRFRVAVHLVKGRTDREIAEELSVSTRLVSDEVRAIVGWLGARSRSHAIAMLVGAG